MAANIFTLMGSIFVDNTQANKSIAKTSEEGYKAGGILSKMGSIALGVSKTVAAASVAVTGAMVAIGGASIRAGMDVDKSMRAIRAQTGMTAEEIGDVETAFRDMALEGNYSASEIAGAMASIAIAGQSPKTAIDLMSASMTLAGATGNDLGDTAKFLGGYLLKVGKDSSYAEKYINLFSGAVQTSGIGLDSLQDYLFRTNASLQTANISGTEATAVFSHLYTQGIKGAQAYSGMNTVIRDLISPSDDLTAAFEQLGVAAFDIEDPSRNALDVLFELADALEANGDPLLRHNVLLELGSDMGTQFSDALFSNRDALRELIPQFEEMSTATDGMGVAFQMAEERTGGMGTQFGRFKNILTEVKLSIFDVIAIPVGEFFSDMNDSLLNAAQNGIPIIQDGILGLFGIIAGVEGAEEQFSGAIKAMIDGMVSRLPEFLQGGVKIILNIVNGIAQSMPNLIDGIVQILPVILGEIAKMLPTLLEAGVNILVAIIGGISKTLPDMIPLIVSMVILIIGTLIENAPLLFEAAAELISALLVGLANALPMLLEYAPQIIIFFAAKLVAAKALAPLLKVGAKWLAKIGAGIIGAKPLIIAGIVAAVIALFVTLFKTEGGAKFLEIGRNIIDSIGRGLTAGVTAVVDTVKNVAGSIANGFKSFFGIKSPSTLFISYGRDIMRGMADGIDRNSRLATNAVRDMSNATFREATRWIENYRMSLGHIASEELKMWEELSTQYSGISRERIEIDRNIARLREELRNQETESERAHRAEREAIEKEYREATFNFSKEWIEKQKELNNLTAQEEIEAWQRVSERYADGTEQRAEADRNLARAREEIRKAEIDAIKEMERLEKAYTDAVEKRATALFNTFGLFSEATFTTTNLDKNTQALEKAQSAYDKVSQEAQEFHDKLGLVARGSEEWAKMQEQAIKISAKYRNAQRELTEATERASTSQAAIMSTNLTTQIDAMTSWSENMQTLSARGIDEGLLAHLRQMGPTANRYLEQLINSSDDELQKLSDLYQEKHELARSLAVAELEGLRKDTDEQISEILSDLKGKMESETNPIGKNMIQGIIDGAESMTGALRKTMTNIAQAAVNAANATLKIRSPSRIFENIGKMVGEGFIDGIESMSGAVDRAVGDVFGDFGAGDISANLNVNRSALTMAGAAPGGGAGGSMRPIEVKIYNYNTINNDMDIDRVSRRLADKTEQELRAKGVK